jgi:hypothetical protein
VGWLEILQPAQLKFFQPANHEDRYWWSTPQIVATVRIHVMHDYSTCYLVAANVADPTFTIAQNALLFVGFPPAVHHSITASLSITGGTSKLFHDCKSLELAFLQPQAIVRLGAFL